MQKKSTLAANLCRLRQLSRISQEAVAERIGVTRQAIAKWESGESMPDLLHCDALAALYNVTLDNLIRYDEREQAGVPIPPKGKYIFGMVTLGEKGQIVLPKKSRDLLRVKAGDTLVVLGDDNPVTGGLAIVPSDRFLSLIHSCTPDR